MTSETKPDARPDALTFLTSKTRSRAMFALFVFFCVEPILSAILGRLAKGGWWLGDFDAVICGAHRLDLGQSPYVQPGDCENLRAAYYVYAPQIGQTLAPLVQALSPWGLHVVYGVLLLPLTGFLLWYAFLKPFPHLPLHMRLMALGAIRGSPITTGNIGGLFHALIVAAVMGIRKARWLFIALVIVASLVKPAFLTMLVVLLYEKRPFARRMLSFIIALLLGVAAVAAIFLTTGPLGEEWRAFMAMIVLHEQPGRGFFAGLTYVAVDPTSPLAFILYVLFAGIMMAGGLVLAEGGELTIEERGFLGLGVAQLINPRLFEYNYDLYLFYPAMALVVMMARPLNARAFFWLSWIYVGTMALDFWINVIGVRILRYFPGTFLVSCGLFVTVVVLVLRRHESLIRSWIQEPASLIPFIRKGLTHDSR